MSPWRSTETYVLLAIFVASAIAVFAMKENGVICAFQVRYALSASSTHAIAGGARATREQTKSELDTRFVPNICSRHQLDTVFEREARNWGY